MSKQIALKSYVPRIKQASNKEEEIEKILNELEREFSLKKFEKIQVIDLFEKYFQDEKKVQENISIGKTTYSKGFDYLGYEPLRATDNSDSLEALDKIRKRILGV
jgi:RNA recognition motif-containing protein